MKQTKHFLVTIVFLLCSLTASAHDFVVNGIYYSLPEYMDFADPVVSVTCMGNSAYDYKNEYRGSITIPSKVTYRGRTYRVNRIEAHAFEDCDALTSVVISQGIESIGIEAFCLCSGLTSITIPKSVQRFGYEAFNYCSSLSDVRVTSVEDWCDNEFGADLNPFYAFSSPEGFASSNPLYYARNLYVNGKLVKQLVIPEGVSSISSYAFVSKNNCFTSITIPASVTNPPRVAFAGCNGEFIVNCNIPSGFFSEFGEIECTKVTIGEGVTSIGSHAFYNCISLVSITIPESVTEIGEKAFEGCKFTSVKCPDRFLDMFEIYAEVGDFVFREGSTPRLVKYNGNSQEIVLPEDFKGKKYAIDKAAFSGLQNFSIVIPEGVTKIESGVFEACGSRLTSVTIPNSVTEIGEGAFKGCSGIRFIVVPEGVTKIGNYAFYGCSSLTSINIPEGVTEIGVSAFCKCNHLASVTIPENSRLTSIGSSAFEGCSGLSLISIPRSVTKIGSSAFNGCSKLTSITIPRGVTKIENYAFNGCGSLTSITIPGGVTKIGEYAFCWCSSLTSVIIPQNVTSVGESAFHGCSNLTSITIPEASKLTSINSNTFCNCRSLTTITIPKCVTKIGEYAFYGCKSLTAITIPESVTKIDNYVFYGCSGLTSIILPDGVTRIGECAFRDCRNLTSITIPESVTEIGERAFEHCSSLTSIVFPENSKLTSIGNGTFSNCRSLTSINILKYVNSIGDAAFKGCTSLKEVIIEDGSTTLSLGHQSYFYKSLGEALFYDCPLESVYLGRDLSYKADVEYGYSPFYRKDKLTSVTIGSLVTSIKKCAFNDCNNLTKVVAPKSWKKTFKEDWESFFKGCPNLKKITYVK